MSARGGGGGEKVELSILFIFLLSCCGLSERFLPLPIAIAWASFRFVLEFYFSLVMLMRLTYFPLGLYTN